MVESTGFGADCPRPHIAPHCSALPNSSRCIRSSILPAPLQILSIISYMRLVPSRQGTHFPQDSSVKNLKKYRATSTIQFRSSMKIIPPEPIMEPMLVSESKSTGISRCCSGMQPPDGPPVCTALNCRFPLIPPPNSKMISRSVMPIGTSMRPVLFTLPTRENILVPLLCFVPIDVYQSNPLFMMCGTLAHVSTLFRLVGLSQSPCSTVCTYLSLGSPDLPSTEDMRAVDSPHTKAPPPR